MIKGSYKKSISEERGLLAMSREDRSVLSIGISTCGVAEIRMAEAFIERQVIATTIDEKGAQFVKEFVASEGYSDQIDVRIEDVREPMPYEDESFDYVYARLVLHYLTVSEFKSALSEMRRVLKTGGRFFIVVRSDSCEDAKLGMWDKIRGMTMYKNADKRMISRFFHTEQSLRASVLSAGLEIDSSHAYEERLCSDFYRKKPSKFVDSLLEVVGRKS